MHGMGHGIPDFSAHGGSSVFFKKLGSESLNSLESRMRRKSLHSFPAYCDGAEKSPLWEGKGVFLLLLFSSGCVLKNNGLDIAHVHKGDSGTLN